MIHIKLFAVLRERAGVAEFDLELPAGATIQTAIAKTALTYPALAGPLQHVAYALNREYAPIDSILSSNDELAMIPPVSGGAP